MHKPFNSKQKLFIDWLARPEKLRFIDGKPVPTQGQLAPILGVTEKTLSQWKQLPGFMQAVNLANAKYALGKFPELTNTLIDRALKENNPKYMEIVFKYLKEDVVRILGSMQEQDTPVLDEDTVMKRIRALPPHEREQAWSVLQMLLAPETEGAIVDQTGEEITAITPYEQLLGDEYGDDTDEQE